MPTAKPEILQGWKDIAQYVARDVRTARRWEKQRGLPVRRMPGEGRTNVYVLVSELDAWLHQLDPAEAEESPATSASESRTVQARDFSFLPRWGVAVATVCLLVAVFFGAAYRHRLRSVRTSSPQAVHLREQALALPAPVASAVPGVEALYLRGVYSYEQRTPAFLLQAEKLLREATEKDPTYAPAHAGLAITYNLIRQYGSMTSAEAYAKSRSEAEQAIALDPKLSDAHAALGFVKFFWDWKSADAESEFKSAIQLDPGSATAHHWYGSMLMHEGRFVDAVVQFDVAQRLEPGTTAVLENRALALGQMPAQRKEAVNILKLVPKQDTTFAGAHLRLANLAYLQPRNIDTYLAEKEVWAIAAHDPKSLANVRSMRRLYESHGERAMWEFEIQQLRTDIASSRTPITPGQRFVLADFESAAGNKDAAFAELEILARRHANEVIGINLAPELASLHTDPRYNAILATMGLPPLH